MSSEVTNTTILGAIQHLSTHDLADIRGKLDLLNGRTRENEQILSALIQWRRDHEIASEDMKGEIKSLRDKTNFVGAALAVVQIIVASVTGIVLGKGGKP